MCCFEQVNACLSTAGLTIELSKMREARLDKAARVLTVQGGVLSGDIDHATAPHKLAVPLGNAPVGMWLYTSAASALDKSMHSGLNVLLKSVPRRHVRVLSCCICWKPAAQTHCGYMHAVGMGIMAAGGGYGQGARALGIVSDSLIAAEIATAAGELVCKLTLPYACHGLSRFAAAGKVKLVYRLSRLLL